MAKSSKGKVITWRVDDDQYEKLKGLTEMTGTTVTYWLNQAYLESMLPAYEFYKSSKDNNE